MGAVYGAVHATTGCHVAVKFLHDEYREDKELLGRFFNEAIASSALNHPGMVQIFDSGMLDGETPYLLMEYLHGLSVEQRLAAFAGQQGLPLCEALNVAWQTAAVLAELESCWIVHRDRSRKTKICLRNGDNAHQRWRTDHDIGYILHIDA